MAERRALSLLVVGPTWPLETFLERLFGGLLDAGVSLTFASAIRPDRTWLDHPHCAWLALPLAKGAIVHRLWRLMRVLAGSFQPVRGYARLKHHTPKGSMKEALKFWLMFLPLARWRGDLIYFPWNQTAIDYLPLFELGLPVVISCRGSQINVAPHNPRRGAMREGLAETFARAKLIHCVSSHIRDQAMRLGLDPGKARIITPAVPLSTARQWPSVREPAAVFKVISVGSLIWRKGYEYGILAIRLLLDRGVIAHYSIVGDGPDRSRLLYAIADLGMRDRVSLLGHLPPPKVAELLLRSNAFLLPSLSEGISNAALEAMALGVPVVSTNCGGMGEVISDGVGGFLVAPRDVATMAERLQRLALDPEMSQRLAAHARAHVEAHCGLDRQVRLFLDMFMEAAGRVTADSPPRPLSGPAPAATRGEG